MGVRDTVRSHVELVRRYKDGGHMVAFDTETDGLHGPLVVAAYADELGTFLVEPGTFDMKWTHSLAKPAIPYVLVGHNLAYDLRVLMREGMELPRCILWDTAVAEHMLDETNPFPDLGKLAVKYLNRELKSWEDVKDDPVALRQYVREDARATRDIALTQQLLLQEQGLLDYFFQIEMPLVPVIADMEHRGVLLDRDEIRKRMLSGEYEVNELKAMLREELHDYDWTCRREGCVNGTYHHKKGTKTSTCTECDGTGINPVVLTSGDIQAEILFKHFALKPTGTTPSGKPSTDKVALAQLEKQAEKQNPRAARYIAKLLRYRKIEKILSTYYGPWLEAGTKRLHPSFHQTGTVSGRWSSSKPNFQNVPPEVRTCVVPDPGQAFVSVDYTQIELYLLATLSGEQSIIEVYESGGDLHQATADAAGVDRHKGKTINFALVYGLGIKSLAEKLNCSMAEAKRIFNRVHSQFPTLEQYRATTVAKAVRDGYVTTMHGRRRRLPDIQSMNHGLRSRAERQAVNHTIQGSAGDLIKCAMIKTVLSDLPVVPVLQIHDEIVWSVPEDKVDVVAPQITGMFLNAYRGLKPRVGMTIMRDRWEAK